MTRKRSFLHNLITTICILVIIGSLGVIAYTFYKRYKEANVYDEAQEIAYQTSDDQIDWAALEAINPDIVAWVKIPGTHIDYPVVQTTDNDYYLYHNYKKEDSGYGTPFLDYLYDLSKEPKPQNAVVYAHNSRDNDAIGFEGLNNYESSEYYTEHPILYYTTKNDGSTPVQYEIVAVIKEPYNFDYRRPEFTDQTDFLNYYNNVLSRKLYDTGKAIHKDDQLVTLTTCVFDEEDGRVAIIARRVS